VKQVNILQFDHFSGKLRKSGQKVGDLIKGHRNVCVPENCITEVVGSDAVVKS